MEKKGLTPQQITGALGEELAANFLTTHHFEILHRNWRSGKCEVDIIAAQSGTLHFFEIKTRSNQQFGLPETKVNNAKLLQLKKAAEAYLEQQPQWKFIQFDIISVLMETGKSPEIFMINDVF